MPLDPLDLLLYYVGLGFVVVLLWFAVLFDAVKVDPPGWTRTATMVLQVAGIVHPAAALAAWDLRRELARERGGPTAVAHRRMPVLVVASLVVAAGVIIGSAQA